MTHELVAHPELPNLADWDKSRTPKFRPCKVSEKEADIGPFNVVRVTAGESKLKTEADEPITLETIAESPSEAPSPKLLEHSKLVDDVQETEADDVN